MTDPTNDYTNPDYEAIGGDPVSERPPIPMPVTVQTEAERLGEPFPREDDRDYDFEVVRSGSAEFLRVVPIEPEPEKPIEIPGGFVARDYIMDPATDDLIRGTSLREDMVVLIGDHMMRDDPEQENPSPYQQQRMRENNRWCRITDLQFNARHSNEVASFIALYADGEKIGRTYGTMHFWLVKK